MPNNNKSTVANKSCGTGGSPNSLPTPSVKGYVFGNLIGKGTYGHVFRATKTGNNRDVVAIKCVLLKKLSKSSVNNVITEISILKTLSHKFIVQMLDFQYDKQFIYLIFEFCHGGELATIMRLKRCFPEEIVRHFLQQLASALKFLRSNDIAHMDLKPQNILITGIMFINLLNGLNSFDVWRNVVLKIADFGFAQHLSNDECANSLRGSPLYMAPEILLGHKYDARVDLWSIGIILFECLFSRTPYKCPSTEDLMKQFTSGHFKISIPPDKISKSCSDLLKSLLEFEPKNRISYEKFFEHSFIDLEHMPDSESYAKASEILTKAIKEDENKNYVQAFHLYREALLYLMPLYRWGDPEKPFNRTKQEALRNRIVQYIERAEILNRKCENNLSNSSDAEKVQHVYKSIDLARQLLDQNLLDESLEKYKSAIELALKTAKQLPKDLKSELFGKINEWMTEAENIKQRLDSTSLEMSKQSKSDNDENFINNEDLKNQTKLSKIKSQNILNQPPTTLQDDSNIEEADYAETINESNETQLKHFLLEPEETKSELSDAGLKQDNRNMSCFIQ